MVVCTLIYNASTGTDTAASGSNAPTAAVTGTNGDTTGSPATITLNETVDFTAGTGVLDDNTDVVWVNTPAGDRHLFRISSFTGGAATCTALVTFDNASNTVTGDSWAVGGIRQNFENDTTNPDFLDMRAGWEFSLQDTADFVVATSVTPIALPSVGDLTDGPIRIVAAAGSTPTITWTETAVLFQLSVNTHVHFEGMTLSNTTATSGACRAIYVFAGSETSLTCIDLTIVSPNGIQVSTGNCRLHVENCDITAPGGNALQLVNGSMRFNIIGCSVHDCGSSGIKVSPANIGGGSIVGCVIYGNGSHGIEYDGSKHNVVTLVHNCVMYDNAGDGVSITGSLHANVGPVSVVNCIFVNNTGHGIDAGTGSAAGGSQFLQEDYNAFFSNTAGELRGVTQGSNDVTLSGDPFTNAASANFSLNSTAGRGAACRDAGFGRTS